MDSVLPLRDIHLPPEVSAFPPAIGWWLLVVLLLEIIVLLILYYRRDRVRRAARNQLDRIADAFSAHGDRQRLATEVSTLLRRVCLSYVPRRDVASLTGSAWRKALDTLPKKESGRFSDDVATQIVRAPYDPRASISPDELLRETRRWVRALPPHRRAA